LSWWGATQDVGSSFLNGVGEAMFGHIRPVSAILLILGFIYSVAAMAFTARSAASPLAIEIMRTIGHVVGFGRSWYIVLLVPITIVLGIMRTRMAASLGILFAYCVIMHLTWLASGPLSPVIILGQIFAPIQFVVALALQVPLYWLVRLASVRGNVQAFRESL
jgi:hypothetical protein